MEGSWLELQMKLGVEEVRWGGCLGTLCVMTTVTNLPRFIDHDNKRVLNDINS